LLFIEIIYGRWNIRDWLSPISYQVWA